MTLIPTPNPKQVYAGNYGNCTFAELEWHFVTDEEQYEALVREKEVVVEGETVDEVEGGGWTRGGEDVRFFLERGLRSAKTQAGPPYPYPYPTRTGALTRAPSPSPTPTPTPTPSHTPTSHPSPNLYSSPPPPPPPLPQEDFEKLPDWKQAELGSNPNPNPNPNPDPNPDPNPNPNPNPHPHPHPHQAALGSVEQWDAVERGRCRTFKKLSDFESKVRRFEDKLRGMGLEGAAAQVTPGPNPSSNPNGRPDLNP